MTTASRIFFTMPPVQCGDIFSVYDFTIVRNKTSFDICREDVKMLTVECAKESHEYNVIFDDDQKTITVAMHDDDVTSTKLIQYNIASNTVSQTFKSIMHQVDKLEADGATELTPEVMQWLLDHTFIKKELKLTEAWKSKFTNHVKCFQSKHCCISAARRGLLYLLKWLKGNGCEWSKSLYSSTACLGAAANGNLDCLKFAHENGCGWGRMTSAWAISSMHFDCLKYAIDNGCPHSYFEKQKLKEWEASKSATCGASVYAKISTLSSAVTNAQHDMCFETKSDCDSLYTMSTWEIEHSCPITCEDCLEWQMDQLKLPVKKTCAAEEPVVEKVVADQPKVESIDDIPKFTLNIDVLPQGHCNQSRLQSLPTNQHDADTVVPSPLPLATFVTLVTNEDEVESEVVEKVKDDITFQTSSGISIERGEECIAFDDLPPFLQSGIDKASNPQVMFPLGFTSSFGNGEMWKDMLENSDQVALVFEKLNPKYAPQWMYEAAKQAASIKIPSSCKGLDIYKQFDFIRKYYAAKSIYSQEDVLMKIVRRDFDLLLKWILESSTRRYHLWQSAILNSSIKCCKFLLDIRHPNLHVEKIKPTPEMMDFLSDAIKIYPRVVFELDLTQSIEFVKIFTSHVKSINAQQMISLMRLSNREMAISNLFKLLRDNDCVFEPSTITLSYCHTKWFLNWSLPNMRTLLDEGFSLNMSLSHKMDKEYLEKLSDLPNLSFDNLVNIALAQQDSDKTFALLTSYPDKHIVSNYFARMLLFSDKKLTKLIGERGYTSSMYSLSSAIRSSNFDLFCKHLYLLEMDETFTQSLCLDFQFIFQRADATPYWIELFGNNFDIINQSFFDVACYTHNFIAIKFMLKKGFVPHASTSKYVQFLKQKAIKKDHVDQAAQYETVLELLK